MSAIYATDNAIKNKEIVSHLREKINLFKKIANVKLRGFAMQPKSEWHEKAIKWFIDVMNK